jgi:hypothetical protein
VDEVTIDVDEIGAVIPAFDDMSIPNLFIKCARLRGHFVYPVLFVALALSAEAATRAR